MTQRARWKCCALEEYWGEEGQLGATVRSPGQALAKVQSSFLCVLGPLHLVLDLPNRCLMPW